MELSKKDLEIYEKINLYKRHLDISNRYSFEDTFENYSNERAIEIVKELGYTAKYKKKENFFQITEITNKILFPFLIKIWVGRDYYILGI